MLSYGKFILEKVSFDKQLFWKEYNNFCRELKKVDCKELIDWLARKSQNTPVSKVDINSHYKS